MINVMSFEEKVMNYLAEIHQKMTVMDNRLIRMENDHGQKLSALFDGYEQNTQAIEQLRQGQERLEYRMDKLEQGQEELSLKVEQNTQAIKSLEDRVATQEIKLQLIK